MFIMSAIAIHVTRPNSMFIMSARFYEGAELWNYVLINKYPN